MNFFEMLVMSRKLSFIDGKVSLYGQEISIYPSRSIMDYILLINEDSELVESVYATAKQSMLEYRAELIKAYNPSKSITWIINTINLYGLGKVEYTGSNPNLPIGEMTAENSPFVQYLKGKVDKPVDSVLKGLIAGMVSAILDSNYDVIELECQATGSSKCKFVLDTKENLVSKFPIECQNQIP